MGESKDSTQAAWPHIKGHAVFLTPRAALCTPLRPLITPCSWPRPSFLPTSDLLEWPRTWPLKLACPGLQATSQQL